MLPWDFERRSSGGKYAATSSAVHDFVSRRKSLPLLVGAVCAVVVQTDGLESVALLQPASVMLEAEFGAVIHREIRAFTIEPLDKNTQLAGSLILRSRIGKKHDQRFW